MGNVVMNIAYGSDHQVPGPKPAAYDFLQAYTISSTFTPAETAWYKVFCFGRSGNGAPATGSKWYVGQGGGGSGGLAASELWLKKGVPVAISITTSQSKFGDYCYATSGGNGSGQYGGGGGRGYNGNIANRNGFAGGNGGDAPSSSAKGGRTGQNGENNGMSGGTGGSSGSSSQQGGSGGGGGGRLPGDDICRYVTPSMLTKYYAGRGGPQSESRYSPAKPADPYPLNIGPQLIVFGGGGGGGGGGYFTVGGAASNGTPGIIIIEKAR